MQASIKSVAQALSRSFLILQSLASVGFCFLLGGTAGMSLRAEATTVQLIAEAASAFPPLSCTITRKESSKFGNFVGSFGLSDTPSAESRLSAPFR